MAQRGFDSLVLKAMKAPDYELTVLDKEQITDHFLRLKFQAGGLLNSHPPFPTQWVRLWVPLGGGKERQRAYTLIDANPETDEVFIEFALHDGPAANWAQNAKPGDSITATVMGAKFNAPAADGSVLHLFGDKASLPAVNSILETLGERSVCVWLHVQDSTDVDLPIRAGANARVKWVEGDENALVDLAHGLDISAKNWVWISTKAPATRALVKYFKNEVKLPKERIESMAYWR